MRTSNDTEKSMTSDDDMELRNVEQNFEREQVSEDDEPELLCQWAARVTDEGQVLGGLEIGDNDDMDRRVFSTETMEIKR